MNKKTLFPVLLLMFFASCQKEISWDTPIDPGPPDPGNPNPTGELLVKSVAVTNGDTTTTVYTYTADDQIETMDISGSSNGLDVGNFRRFYRDASGRIVRIAQKAADQNGIEIDTAFTDVYYPDATTFNYKYSITTLSLFGITTRDSAVFTYDGNGRIIQSYDYMSGVIDDQETKVTYTYDAAGNLSNITGYNNLSGTMELMTTFDMEYDDKPNPIGFRQELLVSGGGPGSSKNNVTVIRFKAEGNTDTQVINNAYTYGANGYPTSMVSVDASDNTTTNYTFYYE